MSNSLDTLITEALRLAGDRSPLCERRGMGGGVRLRTAAGEYLLKTGGKGKPGFFAAEARSLQLIAATGVVRVPLVLAWRDADHGRPQITDGAPTPDPQPPGFILLEWLEAPPGASRERAAETLGSQLAALHRATAPRHGLDEDGYIGESPQPNGWDESWLAFFRERRLGFQAELARRNGSLAGERARRLERLLDRLGEWIDDGGVQPSLLHGDLWGGNWLVGPCGAPALIDPAAYYGDREADLAFTALFGGFPQRFRQAYETTWPLPAGWPERHDLYNLYHLLNHLNLFGEGYGGQVDAILRRYAG